MSQEVLLGEETDLTYIIQNRVSFDMDDEKDVVEYDRAEEEYDFKAGCRNPSNCRAKCRCFVGEKMKKSIAKIKDQVLAYKVINYLQENGCIQNSSHWRTEWKRVNAPDQLRKSRGGGGGGGKGKGMTKEEREEEERKLLLDESYRQKVIEERKKELKKKIQKANEQWEQIQKDYDKWTLELQKYESGDGYVPQEHTAGGGVDQGELSDDPEPYHEEDYQEEQPPPPQTEEEVPPPEPPQEKKKKGRPKKIQGEVVGQMVERLESQNEQV